MRRRAIHWTVRLPDGGLQEWGYCYLEPEGRWDRVVLWWRRRRR